MRAGPYADRESGSGRDRLRILGLFGSEVGGYGTGQWQGASIMTANSATRVNNKTSLQYDADIRRRTEMRIAYYERHPEQIGQRLAELDREWDLERVLRTGSSSISLFGIAMAVMRRAR